LLFENKPTIALTGVTGFLGSHLMATLLSKGYNIIVFGRSAKNESLEERISRLLQWFGIDSCLDQVTCVDTDLSQDNLGIPTGEYSRLCSVVESVIHCASDTSFSESKREKVMAANINNLKGILEFSKNAHVNEESKAASQNILAPRREY
jgi:nucleoside-diphosphate-sugar epimerase